MFLGRHVEGPDSQVYGGHAAPMAHLHSQWLSASLVAPITADAGDTCQPVEGEG